MNIFARIGFINRALNAIKEIKKLIDTTTVDDELKQYFKELVAILEKIKNKVPEIGDFVSQLVEIIKKNFKFGKNV